MRPAYFIYVCPIEDCDYWSEMGGFCQRVDDHPHCQLVRVTTQKNIVDEAQKLMRDYPASESMFGAAGKTEGVRELVEALTGLKLDSNGVPCDQDAKSRG